MSLSNNDNVINGELFTENSYSLFLMSMSLTDLLYIKSLRKWKRFNHLSFSFICKSSYDLEVML